MFQGNLNNHIGQCLPVAGHVSKGEKFGDSCSQTYTFTFASNFPDQEMMNQIRFIMDKTYGNQTRKLNFYLPDENLGNCLTGSYTYYSKIQGSSNGTLFGISDGQKFTYLRNPGNVKELLVANSVLLRDVQISETVYAAGQALPHQENLGFLKYPKISATIQVRFYFFVKELLDNGIFVLFEGRSQNESDSDTAYRTLSAYLGIMKRLGKSTLQFPLTMTKTIKKKITPFGNMKDFSYWNFGQYFSAETSTNAEGIPEDEPFEESFRTPSDVEIEAVINDLAIPIPEKILSKSGLLDYERQNNLPLSSWDMNALKEKIKEADNFFREYYSSKRSDISEKTLQKALDKRIALISAYCYKVLSQGD